METTNVDPRLLKLLREIAELSEHASLTGSLEGGAGRVATRYNTLLDQFIKQGNAPAGLFSTLDPSSAYGEIAVEARMLAGFLENGNGKEGRRKDRGDASVLVRLAPFVDSNDLSALVREYASKNAVMDSGTLTALAPFLDRSILGDLVRGHLMGSKAEAPEAPAAPSAPTAHKPPEPASQPAPVPQPTTDIVARADMTPRPTLEDLAAKLREPGLSVEERQQIAIHLAEVAHEQTHLP